MQGRGAEVRIPISDVTLSSHTIRRRIYSSFVRSYMALLLNYGRLTILLHIAYMHHARCI